MLSRATTVFNRVRKFVETLRGNAENNFGTLYSPYFNDKPASVLCLDHVFRRTLNLKTMRTLSEVHDILSAFHGYTAVLGDAAFIPDPCHRDGIQRLFGFTITEDNTVNVFAGTLLHTAVQQAIPGSKRAVELVPILRRVIQNILRTCVQGENWMCKRCPVLFPCSVYTINGWWCGLESCRKGHGFRDALSISSVHFRLRIMMLQVSIFHTAEYLVERRDRIDQRRIWLQNIYNLLHPIHHSLGSFANIHLANFPEAQKAIPIINHWVEDCLFSLRSDRFSPFFLNNLVQMSSLAFLLNRFRAQRYLGIIPCVQKEPLRRYIREDNMNIVHDILKLLDGSGELPIVAGVLFLKRVVSAKLWINFSNVCSILESICYSIVITRRLRNGSLHNTILPRQWILTLPTANSESIAARSIPINLVVELVDIVHALLVGIFSNNPEDFEYLLFEYRNWQESDLWQIIYISLSRICRSLCLLSCNMATPLIRDRIVSTIQILAKSQHEFPAFCAMYAEARNWDELWFALRASGQQPRSTLDELLFLQDETRAPPKKIWGTRTIPYREWSAALNDLQATASGSHNDANHSRNIAVQSNADDLEKDGDDGMRVHAISTSHEDIASEELPADVVEPLAAADDIIVNDSLASEEQVKAARTIQRAYRNFFRRRSDRAYRSLFQQRYSHAALIILKAYRQYRVRKDTHPSRIVERRYRLRSACHATVAQESLSGLYKSYFCDQLPHALVCLEEMYAYVSKCKEADGKRLRGNKVVLEEVHAIMANNVALFKQVTGLQKALGPRSELHRSQNVDLLKQKILELEQLVRKLPQGISNEWAFDFRMAMRAMKGVDEVRRKEKRPRLNIDDIDLVYS